MSSVLPDVDAPTLWRRWPMMPSVGGSVIAAGLGVAALVLSGCASGTTTTPSPTPPNASPTAPPATASSAVNPPPTRPRRSPRPVAASAARPGSLAHSTASNDTIQAQPPPGSCHAIGSGLSSRPDPRCTPGALNPAVTQATIDRTICVDGWTTTVRPPESVTEPEKAASMVAYGDTGSMADYEYDHLVPLELGGATNDARNLWPEPGASPNPKDAVEDELRQQVCDGQLSLARAQREITSDWVMLARPSATPAPSRPATATVPAQGECTLTAAYSSRFNDYDVYVHSNQPDQTVTVTDANGHSDSWHTDGSGYADVYFKPGGYAPERQITARVGQAACSGTL